MHTTKMYKSDILFFCAPFAIPYESASIFKHKISSEKDNILYFILKFLIWLVFVCKIYKFIYNKKCRDMLNFRAKKIQK